jgi:hypothetical protein
MFKNIKDYFNNNGIYIYDGSDDEEPDITIVL